MSKESSKSKVGNKLTIAGGLLWSISLFSMLANSIGYETTLTTWVGNWGIKAGWIIRIAMFMIGLLIFGAGMKADLKKEE